MRYRWSHVTALMVLAAPAAAQLSGRADVTAGGRYLWHGISRAGGLVAQPSLAVGLRVRRISLEGGAVLHYELDHVSPGELSESGVGGPRLGEEDLWGRASLTLGWVRLQSGVVRYLFRGDSTADGLGPGSNTTEVYAALSGASSRFNPALEAWWDVDRVHGAFLRASVDVPILGWPFAPYTFGFVEGEAGLNLGQVNFARRGVTHAGLGVGVETRPKRLPGVGLTTLAAGLRSQLNLDDATRFNGAGKRRDFLFWAWTGMTVVMGGDARSLR
jgi:hypothetical protein